MMKIELLRADRFRISGIGALKMMQNKSIPALDLIVRESIQNALDAALESANCVEMHFQHGSFNAKALEDNFEFIGDTLKTRYSNTDQSFLAISDANTYGLTGDLDTISQPNSNLNKLVFDIMKPQDKEGAGGSWGIGKTVFFRIGIGLVIFYSRIKLEDGAFQERLVATLVENEEKPNGLLSSEKGTIGIAFFGDMQADGKVTAVTDSNQIHEFLNIFKLTPLTDSATGTTIIIPFIDEKLLLENSLTEDEEKRWWQDNLEDYLQVSILRWYFPRLSLNYPKEYGPRLVAFVNDQEVQSDINTPIFAKLQELYTACYSKENPPNWIRKVAINKAGLTEDALGWLCFGKVTQEELSIVDKHLPAPYEFVQINNCAEEQNSPIIAFTRKPGMVVNYYANGEAIGKVSSPSNEYIIGVFSLNSRNTLNGKTKINLDEYIRNSEKSDHLSWSDYEREPGERTTRIVRTINQKIKDALNSAYNEKPVTTESTINTNFAKKFGKLLLPDEGFGKQGSSRIPTNEGGRGSGGVEANKNYSIELNEHTYTEKRLTLEYQIRLKESVKRITCVADINSVNNHISPDKYEESGLAYPFNIPNVTLQLISVAKKSPQPVLYFLNDENSKIRIVEPKLSFELYKTKSGKNCAFSLFKDSETNGDLNFVIRFILDSKDPLLEAYVDFKVEEAKR